MLDTPACADIDTHFPKSRVLNTHYPLDVLPNQFHDRKTVLGKDRKTDPAMLIIYCCKPVACTLEFLDILLCVAALHPYTNNTPIS